MTEKAEEWAGKVEWMGRKDGQLEVERGRLVWSMQQRYSGQVEGLQQED